jgi:predicted DNA-binding transcriptional regulator YafY
MNGGQIVYTEPTKKLILLNILDILKKYTDGEHKLTQNEIVDKLQKEYSMKVDRKSVKHNLMDLREFGYCVECDDSKTRMITSHDPKTGEKQKVESIIYTDFHLKRDFADAELRLLIDSVLYSNYIPTKHGKELIEKLLNLSSVYFKDKMRHVDTAPEKRVINPQFFYTVDVLNDAISKGCKVTFSYCDYGTDKKLHEKRNKDGSLKKYVVSPYQMAVKEDKYFLICNYDKYNDITNYRVDRIKDIEILKDVSIKPFEQLDEAIERNLNLQEYMAEHIYMFAGDSVHARFRIPHAMIGDVIDVFGQDVRFMDETDTHVTVLAYVNEQAMLQYAKSFAPDVVVLGPEKLVEKVKSDLDRSIQLYKR